MKLAETIKAKERRGIGGQRDPLTVKALAFWYPFASADDADYFADGLRRAGLPD